MKFWSILTLLFIINFTALPSIAAICGWKTEQNNVIVNEEEPNCSFTPCIISEKTLPKTLNVHDFLKFFELDIEQSPFVIIDDSYRISPFLTIFSPPPEA